MKVELIDSMGSDLSVVNAARVSFDKFKDEFGKGDEGLIKYLATHNHFTPFTQVTYQVRITAPIFIARQWFKHQIGISRNEVSRRYVSDTPTFWGSGSTHRVAPFGIQWRESVENKKQGSGDQIPYGDKWLAINDIYVVACEQAKEDYNTLLEMGVCPEQARAILPQSMNTTWIETGSLSAAARIYSLRVDPHAQKEICDLAKDFGALIGPIAPVSWKYLTKVP